MNEMLLRHVDYPETQPAPDYANSRVGTYEHQRQELVSRAKHEVMQQRTIDRERHGHNDV